MKRVPNETKAKIGEPRMLIEVNAAPHCDLTLSIEARALLTVIQVFPETDWGSIPPIFIAKILNTTREVVDVAFAELYDKHGIWVAKQ